MYTSFFSTITLAGAFAEATRAAHARDNRNAGQALTDSSAKCAPSLAAWLGEWLGRPSGTVAVMSR